MLLGFTVRSGLGHGGDQIRVWVTVEIVFEIGFGF